MHTHFQAALLTDEEYLEQALRRSGPDGEAGLDRGALVRWTPEVATLADLVDEVRMLRGAVIASAGGKPGEPRRYDRPRTAMDKVRHGIAREKHERLTARVLSNRETGE